MRNIGSYAQNYYWLSMVSKGTVPKALWWKL